LESLLWFNNIIVSSLATKVSFSVLHGFAMQHRESGLFYFICMGNDTALRTSFDTAELVTWPTKLDLKSLQTEFGTPTWIVSEDQLQRNLNAFERFTTSKSNILYPVKANPAFAVLHILAQAGAGADCANQSEVDLARYAGFNFDRISYNTPAPDLKLCLKLLSSGATVVLDDWLTIGQLNSLASNRANLNGKIVIRVNLERHVGYTNETANQDLMAHASTSSKFGIPSEDLIELLAKTQLPITGLHVHVGTQMDNLASFETAMHQMHELAMALKEQGHNITDINLGGGLGIPFHQQQRFPSIESFTDLLNSRKKENFNYYLEPGHALVGNAVALLTRVLTIKQSRGKKWVVVDVGTDQLAKVTLLHWPHRILDQNGEQLKSGLDVIAGPLCFAGDNLLEHISAEGLSIDAPLLITEAGAYTYALSNRFNGRLAPGWVVLKGDNQLVQLMEREGRYDHPQITSYQWHNPANPINPESIPLEQTLALSSAYLKELAKADGFEYEKVMRLARGLYQFTIRTSSEVGFISMPFAIRIFGDATIVALMHHFGHAKKDVSVWGRRLTLDCFEIIQSNTSIQFTVALSENKSLVGSNTLAYFKTSCGMAAGCIIIKV
jgi:diaminopimelate decarboxylase